MTISLTFTPVVAHQALRLVEKCQDSDWSQLFLEYLVEFPYAAETQNLNDLTTDKNFLKLFSKWRKAGLSTKNRGQIWTAFLIAWEVYSFKLFSIH